METLPRRGGRSHRFHCRGACTMFTGVLHWRSHLEGGQWSEAEVAPLGLSTNC
ncbi:hypothetical protein FOXYSP1_19268 [Fusarium oxysporum f. sp. phaseoli]